MNSELASSLSLSRLKTSASLNGGSSETTSHDGDNQTNDKATGKFVEIYGEMISDSLKINNNSLIECLDDILQTLNSYFILLDKVCRFIKLFILYYF